MKNYVFIKWGYEAKMFPLIKWNRIKPIMYYPKITKIEKLFYRMKSYFSR
jgi:hypothetical protein